MRHTFLSQNCRHLEPATLRSSLLRLLVNPTLTMWKLLLNKIHIRPHSAFCRTDVCTDDVNRRNPTDVVQSAGAIVYCLLPLRHESRVCVPCPPAVVYYHLVPMVLDTLWCDSFFTNHFLLINASTEHSRSLIVGSVGGLDSNVVGSLTVRGFSFSYFNLEFSQILLICNLI